MPKRQRPARIDVCTHCLALGPVTDDHVPPRNLFPPGTLGLVKVPACTACNNGSSKNDEYFRLSITLSHDPDASPPGTDVTRKAIDRLRAPEKAGLKHLVLSQRGPVTVHSEDGRVLGYTSGMSVDSERIKSVLVRTVKGLFRHHIGRPLPATHSVHLWWVPELVAAGATEPAAALLSLARSGEERTIGGHVFSYQFAEVPESENDTLWDLRFFGVFEFLAITTPTSDGGV